MKTKLSAETTFIFKDNEYPLPFFEKDNISLVIITDQNYLAYAMSLIQNIIETASLDKNYDIILLVSHISDETLKYCLKAVEDYANISLRFVDHSRYLRSKENLRINRWSLSLYYKLMISDIFKNFNKVLFLDTDILVKRDVADLYNLDIQNYYLAATHDFLMQLTKRPEAVIGHFQEFYQGTYKDYFIEYVGLKNLDKQFNSGIILFNIKKIRENNIHQELFSELDTQKSYDGAEEDMHNRVFNQRELYFLDYEWNFPYYNEERILYPVVLDWMSESLKASSQKRMKDSFILHPYLTYKFWDFKDPKDENSSLYWEIASRSLMYEKVLYNLTKKSIESLNKRIDNFDYELYHVRNNFIQKKKLFSGFKNLLIRILNKFNIKK